jgi:hypothetical protein
MMRLTAAIPAILVAWALQLEAHHPFADTYLADVNVAVEGTLTEWIYRQPHSFLILMALDGGRQPVRWIVEWDTATRLGSQGITPRTLRVGDRVVVSGSPGRIPSEHRLRLRTIARPADGWTWPAAAR